MNEDEMNTEETEVRVAPDVAEDEFWRWAEAMDLLIEPGDIDEEQQTAKKRIIRAIKRGHLVIDEDGYAVFTPYCSVSSYTDSLKFREPDGAVFSSSDKKKQNERFGGAHAQMAALCKVHPNVFGSDKIRGEDYKICQALYIFLMV